MTDKKDPLSAHNPPVDDHEIQECDTEHGNHDVEQATELDISSPQKEKDTRDSCYPQREGLMKTQRGSAFSRNVGKLKIVSVEFKTDNRFNSADEEKADASEMEVADLLESTPATVLHVEVSQDQASEVHEEAPTQKMATTMHSIEPTQEELIASQQPMETLNQQNGDDMINNGSEHKEEDAFEEKAEAADTNFKVADLESSPVVQHISQNSDAEDGYYDMTELMITSISSDEEFEDTEEATDSLSPTHKEWLRVSKDGAFPENVGKLKIVFDYETGNAADEEKAETADTKEADLIECTPAVLDGSQYQVYEVHKEAPTQENGHGHSNIEPEVHGEVPSPETGHYHSIEHEVHEDIPSPEYGHDNSIEPKVHEEVSSPENGHDNSIEPKVHKEAPTQKNGHGHSPEVHEEVPSPENGHDHSIEHEVHEDISSPEYGHDHSNIEPEVHEEVPSPENGHDNSIEPKVHETQENDHIIDHCSIGPIQEESSQQPTEFFSQQCGTDAKKLLDNGLEHKENKDADEEKTEAADTKVLEVFEDSDTEDGNYDVRQVTELEITSISSDEEDAQEVTNSLSTMNNEWIQKDSVGQVITELVMTSVSSDEKDAEEATDSLSPMRKEWILKGSAFPDKSVGKLKAVLEFKSNNSTDEEKAETAEMKVADVLVIESTPAVVEVSQDQASEVHEEAQTQENGHAIESTTMQEESSQQPTEILNRESQNGADSIINLPDSESEHKEEDQREKIMPKEIRHKVTSVVPALLKVVEDDKTRCCGCNCDCSTSCLNTCCLPCNNPFKRDQCKTLILKKKNFKSSMKHCKKEARLGERYFRRLFFH
jgi:hypothetical protein